MATLSLTSLETIAFCGERITAVEKQEIHEVLEENGKAALGAAA